MDKRYQVFISSTFEDLKQERQEVLKAVLLQNHMPAGMELFAASDEDAWQLIRDVIDTSDYYVLIIAGRYGSRDEAGIGFTEKEYDYAIEKKKPVIPLLHQNPDNLPRTKTETDETIWKKLQTFRAKVQKNHVCDYWNSPEELKSKVIIGLVSAVNKYPMIGWVRADKVSSEELLNEINEIRKENDALKQSLTEYTRSVEVDISDLASMDETYDVKGIYHHHGGRGTWSLKLTWREIFGLIAPYLLQHPNENFVEEALKESAFDKTSHVPEITSYLDAQIFQTIKIQLMAQKLVHVKYSQSAKDGYALLWSLTPKGEALMFEERTIRAKEASTKAIE